MVSPTDGDLDIRTVVGYAKALKLRIEFGVLVAAQGDTDVSDAKTSSP